MTQSTELLPCPTPWCEHTDTPYTWQGSDDRYVVICADCQVEGPSCDTEAEAIAAWNTRSTPDRNAVLESDEQIVQRVTEEERLVSIFKTLPLHGDAGCDKLAEEEWLIVAQTALAALTTTPEPTDPAGVSGVGDEPCEGGAHCCCCGPGEPCCDCGKIMPGFTPDEVDHLNEWQRAGIVHEFTCGNDHDGDRTLFATVRGWICPCCDYTQDWAHDYMKDGSGLASQQQARAALRPSPVLEVAKEALELAGNRLSRCAVEAVGTNLQYEWSEWAADARAALQAINERAGQ